ncbi:hypothetical protein AAFF_G00332630 [Aldrovandia affinis]|uniref:Uncharacterized protein n=1 Tax=Aldrovandia affinis TaxID=143900 RepID=A0AAD7WPQ4_9TELE|nr:hypothetical protein AAFF_G00332630 [Aldrovandia affinis]
MAESNKKQTTPPVSTSTQWTTPRGETSRMAGTQARSAGSAEAGQMRGSVTRALGHEHCTGPHVQTEERRFLCLYWFLSPAVTALPVAIVSLEPRSQ